MLFNTSFTLGLLPSTTKTRQLQGSISSVESSFNIINDVTSYPVPPRSAPGPSKYDSISSHIPFFSSKRHSLSTSSSVPDIDYDSSQKDSRISKFSSPRISKTSSGESARDRRELRCGGDITDGRGGNWQLNRDHHDKARERVGQLMVPAPPLTPPATPRATMPRSVVKGLKKLQHSLPLDVSESPVSTTIEAFRSQIERDEAVSPFSSPTYAKGSPRQGKYKGRAAVRFGLGLLVDTLNDISTDTTSKNMMLDIAPPKTCPSTPRLGSPMPSINEEVEPGSRPSTASDSLPPTPTSLLSPMRKGSNASTIPTSVSGLSLPDTPATDIFPKSSPPRNGTFLFLDEASTTQFSSQPQPIDSPTEVIPGSSCRSSVTTFFCRGNQGLQPNKHISIGVGSICTQEIDLEANLDDLTSYPGIDNLKNQISWLSTDFTDEDEESDEDSDEDDYHSYQKRLSHAMTKRLSTNSSQLLVASDVVGTRVETPRPRLSRRRTASSECIVLDVLQKLELPDTASLISIGTDRASTTKEGFLEDVRIPAMHDRWTGMSWDTVGTSDSTALEMLLDSEISRFREGFA